MSLLRPDEQQKLAGLLLQLPNIDDPAVRQALLDCLPQGLQNSIPYSDQATVHIANIVAVSNADAWNPLPDGTWAPLLLLDTAASQVEGSTLGLDLKALRDTVQARAAQLPPRPAAETPAAIPLTVPAATPIPAATPRSLLLRPPRVYFLGASVLAVVLCVGLGLVAALTPSADTLTPTPPSPADTLEYRWERYDTDLTVNKDGSFDSVDTQVVSFTRGIFKTGYRSVPIRDGAQIQDYQVTQITDRAERIPYTRYTGSYDLPAGRFPPARTFITAQEGTAFAVHWFTAPITAPARLTIEVRYRVLQGLRLDSGGDELDWKGAPTNRAAAIAHSRVRVHLPPEINMADVRAQIHPEGIAALGMSGSTITFDSVREIAPGEAVEVQVRWPHGIVGEP